MPVYTHFAEEMSQDDISNRIQSVISSWANDSKKKKDENLIGIKEHLSQITWGSNVTPLAQLKTLKLLIISKCLGNVSSLQIIWLFSVCIPKYPSKWRCIKHSMAFYIGLWLGYVHNYNQLD